MRLIDDPRFPRALLAWSLIGGFLAAIQHDPWLVLLFIVAGVFSIVSIVQRGKEDDQ